MGNAAFTLVAGHVALDFINTLDNRYVPEQTVDLVATYDGLLNFFEQANIVKALDAQRLRRKTAEIEKRHALVEAGELREVLFDVFSNVASGKRVRADDLAAFNEHVSRALKHRSVGYSDQTFEWTWEEPDLKADSPLWRISLAAAELLVSDNLQYVRECGAETCRWLFLDLSKNHQRRWCDMKTCGNRQKARRYYQKHGAL